MWASLRVWWLPQTGLLTLLPAPVSQVYQEPLAAALSSNRAILSFTDVQLILSPVAQLLELNRCVPARLLLWRVCVFCDVLNSKF